MKADAEKLVQVPEGIHPARSQMERNDLPGDLDLVLEPGALSGPFEFLDGGRVRLGLLHRPLEEVQHLVGRVLDQAPEVGQGAYPVGVVAQRHPLEVQRAPVAQGFRELLGDRYLKFRVLPRLQEARGAAAAPPPDHPDAERGLIAVAALVP